MKQFRVFSRTKMLVSNNSNSHNILEPNMIYINVLCPLGNFPTPMSKFPMSLERLKFYFLRD